MLSAPAHGWATISVGEHSLPVSHIQPVPEMLLTAFIRALSTGSAADVAFDAEGEKWCMEVGHETCLTLMGRSPETHAIPVSATALAQEALGDVRRDMDAWSRWNPGESAESQRAVLTRLCSRLEELLA